jgi:hypothetical protein
MYNCKNEKGWLIPESRIEWVSGEEYTKRKNEVRRLLQADSINWFDGIREEGRTSVPNNEIGPLNSVENVDINGFDPANISAFTRRL